MVQFSKLELQADGTVKQTLTRSLPQSAISACPHVIFDPTHYRADGSCRCNDKDHKEMNTWGYKWEDGQWR